MRETNGAEEPEVVDAGLLDAIFDSSEFLIAHLDRELRFVRVNRAYAEAGEMAPEEFVGRRHFDLYPNDENEAIFRAAIESGVPQTRREKPFEYPDQPERGVTCWNWTVRPVISAAGEPTGLLLTLVDVTEGLRARRLANDREVLLRELAHRVRNNLQVISSMVQGLGASSTREEIESVKSRILVMARVYEAFDSGPEIDVEIGRCVRRIWDDLRVELRGAGDALEVVGTLRSDLEGATPLALIVHELLRPCVTCRLADRCRPRVELHDGPDGSRVSIRCAGLEADEDARRARPDMCLVNGLASQIGAELRPSASPAISWELELRARPSRS